MKRGKREKSYCPAARWLYLLIPVTTAISICIYVSKPGINGGRRKIIIKMSKSKTVSQCLLGIEDEPVDETFANFQTNKVGGKPNWVKDIHSNPRCKLCGRHLPLVTQVYAPLDESVNHRTLYLFGCINPSCFGKSDSWQCLRDEVMDQTMVLGKSSARNEITASTSSWLEDADNWGDETSNEEAIDGENGNSSNNNDDITGSCIGGSNFESLALSSDSNANKGAEACSPVSSDPVSAEIELEDTENEPVVIETPTRPTINLEALCSSSVSEEILSLKEPEFSSFYINVLDESSVQVSSHIDHHALELLTEYQKREGTDFKKTAAKSDSESYEKAKPGHGSDLVHKFVTQTKKYPEQLLRYSRLNESSPMLLQPLHDSLPSCSYCGGSLVFELQLMPHLTQRLTLIGFPETCEPVEFSTVIIFTCNRSCWIDGSSPRKEHVVVQSDTL